ncbi:MAG: lipopolysaccharide biosynthesis protein [Vicinamibacterales bacterium]
MNTALVGRALAFLRRSDGGVWARTLRSGVWVSLSVLIVNSLQIVRSFVLARLLTPEMFGLMALCLIVIRGIEVFSETGVRPALIHRREGFEEARDTAFCVMAVRGFVLAGIATAIGPAAAWYYDEPRLVPLIATLALSFAIVGFSNINTIRLEKELQFRRLAHLEQFGAIASFVIVVSLAYWMRSVWALVIGQVLGAAAGVVASYLMVPGRPRFVFRRDLARELLRYGRFVTGLAIVLFFTTEADNMVVGKILGLDALGFYLIAYTLANLPATHIAKVLSRIMFPAYAILRDDPKRLVAGYLATSEVVGVVSLAAAAGLYTLAEDIVRIGYGPRWLAAVPAMRILALFGALRAVTMINGYVFNAIGRPNLPFYLNSAKLVVILATIVPATRQYGLVGTSLAVTLPSAAFFFVSMAQLDRFAQVPWRASIRVLIRPVLTATAIIVVVGASRSHMSSVGLPALVALIGMGGALAGLLNIDVFKRVYREQRYHRPTAAPA